MLSLSPPSPPHIILLHILSHVPQSRSIHSCLNTPWEGSCSVGCVCVCMCMHTKISCAFKRLYMSMCNIRERSSLSVSLSVSLSLCLPPPLHTLFYCILSHVPQSRSIHSCLNTRDLALLVVCVCMCMCTRVCVHILCQCSECAGIYNVHVYMHTFVYVGYNVTPWTSISDSLFLPSPFPSRGNFTNY